MFGFRDSSAQNHFGLALLGRGIKTLYLMETNVYLVFYFNIGFSTIRTRNVKKGKHVSIQTNEIFILCGTVGPTLEQLILVHNKFIISF